MTSDKQQGALIKALGGIRNARLCCDNAVTASVMGTTSFHNAVSARDYCDEALKELNKFIDVVPDISGSIDGEELKKIRAKDVVTILK